MQPGCIFMLRASTGKKLLLRKQNPCIGAGAYILFEKEDRNEQTALGHLAASGAVCFIFKSAIC